MKGTLRQSMLSLALLGTALGGASWSTASHACAVDPYLGTICIMATPNNYGAFSNTYIPAQGQLLVLIQNQALYAVMGTTWGGDGRTTVGVPDLRGRVVVGSGASPAFGTFTTGQASGSTTVTLSQLQLPQHAHTLTAATVDISKMTATTSMTGVSATVSGLTLNGATGGTLGNDPSGKALGTVAPASPAKIYTDAAPSIAMNAGSISGGSVGFSGNPTTTPGGTVTVSGSTSTAGSSQPVSVMQPYLVMNYYLATNGVFPTRD